MDQHIGISCIHLYRCLMQTAAINNEVNSAFPLEYFFHHDHEPMLMFLKDNFKKD